MTTEKKEGGEGLSILKENQWLSNKSKYVLGGKIQHA
jgi:hypothetical protein